MFRLPSLGNGCADSVEVWYALRDRLFTAYAAITGVVSLHVQTAFLYLRNGLTDCVQIYYVGWGSLSTCFPQVMGGVGHLCTCARAPPPPISVSQDPIEQFC